MKTLYEVEGMSKFPSLQGIYPTKIFYATFDKADAVIHLRKIRRANKNYDVEIKS